MPRSIWSETVHFHEVWRRSSAAPARHAPMVARATATAATAGVECNMRTDIHGRSKMSKCELVDALAERR